MLYLKEKRLSESIMYMMVSVMNTHASVYICVFHLKKNPLISVILSASEAINFKCKYCAH